MHVYHVENLVKKMTNYSVIAHMKKKNVIILDILAWTLKLQSNLVYSKS